jgi:hypothetical protein
MIRGRQRLVFVSTTNTASSLAGSVLLALRLIKMCSRRLIPALARAVAVFGLTLYLACDLTRNDVRIDERRVRVMVRCGGATKRV